MTASYERRSVVTAWEGNAVIQPPLKSWICSERMLLLPCQWIMNEYPRCSSQHFSIFLRCFYVLFLPCMTELCHYTVSLGMFGVHNIQKMTWLERIRVRAGTKPGQGNPLMCFTGSVESFKNTFPQRPSRDVSLAHWTVLMREQMFTLRGLLSFSRTCSHCRANLRSLLSGSFPLCSPQSRWLGWSKRFYSLL